MNGNEQCCLERIQRVYDILHGKAQAELLLKNVRILDVFGENVFHGSILMDGGRIVALNPAEAEISVKETFDGQGLYAIPGLIDAHFHFESQLATPTALAELMTPRGTTTVFAEILDLISSAREEGLKAAKGILREREKLPYRLFAFAPGKKVEAQITREILKLEPVIGLGEFDHFSYRAGNRDDFMKAAWAKARGGFINGHWGLTVLSDMELNFLPAIGVNNNHDVWNAEDIKKSLRNGFATQIKFGVGSQSVIETLLKAIVEEKFPTENFMLCSDNESMHRMKREGHMDYIINLCIARGIPAIKAIKMATVNTARAFHMEADLGSLAPGRYGDVVLTDSLEKVNARYVFRGGRLVAAEGALLEHPRIDYSGLCTKGVAGLSGMSAEDLELRPAFTPEGKARAMLFDVFGRGHATFAQEIELEVRDGRIVPEYQGKPLSRISVFQRYPNGERHIVNGYITGLYLGCGACAISFPAPVPYLIAVGVEPEEMLSCAREVDGYSGAFVVSDGSKTLAVLPLEIYGMMANLSIEELLRATGDTDAAAATLGYTVEGEPLANKLLSLFISLHRFGFMQE